MEEDIVQGVLRGKLETVRDTDSAVNAGAGASALAHGAPADAGRPSGDFRGEFTQKGIDPAS